ncbi:MAG TPA: phage capsid protein [Dehalococcoidia bacterium]|nr:phage capsid protein [Dehalococcoidia bacterium]
MPDITTTTQAADMQTLIARGLIVYTMPNLAFPQVFTDVEGDFQIGQTYSKETLTRIAATAGTATGPTATAYSAPTETAVQLTINKIYYGAIRLAQIVDAITTHDWGALYQQSIRDGLKVVVDSQLATLVAGFSQQRGTAGSPLTDDDIRAAVEFLDNADAPKTNRYGVLSPSEKNAKLALERWSSGDYAANDVMREGVFQRIYGIDWLMSTNLVVNGSGHENVVCHKEAAIFAIRRDADAETFDLNNPNNLSRELALTVIFGFVEQRDAFGVRLLGK